MRITGESSVVLKIHDNVFLGLHYTIFCIRMDSRRIYRPCIGNFSKKLRGCPK